MTAPDLRALVRAIAEAAAPHVGARPSQTQHHTRTFGPHFGDELRSISRQTVHLAARAGAWRAKGYERGTPGAPLDAAAVLALRERLQAQRDERARLLAADDAALRVLDETARVYDAATLDAAIIETCERLHCDVTRWRVKVAAGLPPTAPWSRTQIDRAAESDAFTIACDAILRRRAAEAPQGGGQVALPADVSADGAVTVRVPGREP